MYRHGYLFFFLFIHFSLQRKKNFFWSICPLKKYYQFESEKNERCTNSSNFASIEILDYKFSEVIHKMFTLSFIYIRFALLSFGLWKCVVGGLGTKGLRRWSSCDAIGAIPGSTLSYVLYFWSLWIAGEIISLKKCRCESS